MRLLYARRLALVNSIGQVRKNVSYKIKEHKIEDFLKKRLFYILYSRVLGHFRIYRNDVIPRRDGRSESFRYLYVAREI